LQEKEARRTERDRRCLGADYAGYCDKNCNDCDKPRLTRTVELDKPVSRGDGEPERIDVAAPDIFAGMDEAETAKSVYAKICFTHGKALLSSTKHIDKSISMLLKAVELKPDENDYRYNLAQAYYNKGEFQAAMTTLDALPKDERPKYYVQELKAQIMTAIGEPEKAISLLLALTRFRKRDYIYQRLAENYIVIDDFKKATEFAKLAIDTNNSNYKNFLICGEVYKAKKQYKTAVAYFEQARVKRQNKFKQDCPEAIRLIEEIMSITNNNPMDSISVDENVQCLQNNNGRRIGKVIKYDNSRGFGFIIENGTSDSYFVHFRHYPKGVLPEVGQI
jgi:tetratricopeptide (TPR) repeat protein